MQTFRQHIQHTKTDTQNEIANVQENVQDTIAQDPTNPEKLLEARDKIYNLVLYKGRTIRLLCCQKFATLNFSKGNF
jgi:hypothetical protein